MVSEQVRFNSHWVQIEKNVLEIKYRCTKAEDLTRVYIWT